MKQHLILIYFCLVFSLQGSVAAKTSQPDVNFKFAGIDGKQHQLTDYREQWVVINFWATWCSPCIREIPELTHFYDEYHRQGVTVLGVNYEELTTEQIQQAVKEFRINYPVLYLGADSYMSEEMVLKGLPSTFIISPEGRLVKAWVGPVNKQDLTNFIRPYLPEPTSNVPLHQ